MSYKALILAALLLPRVEFLGIPGVNSGMRIDVVAMLLVSFIPIVLGISLRSLFAICVIVLATIIQLSLFEGSIIRALVGASSYVSIITFSQYHKYLSRNDIFFICKWFLIVNCFLHIAETIFSLNGDHNFTGRYGIFNQHFAFASAILICFFYLLVNNRTTFLTTALFALAFLLSGSRGLMVGAVMGMLAANYNVIKHFHVYLSALIVSGLVLVMMSFSSIEHYQIQRAISAVQVVTESLGDLSKLALDPAFNVRLGNIQNYFEDLSTRSFSGIAFLLGGGPYSFLDYSVQFNRPGHFDNLYFRLLSEYGILTIIVLGFLVWECRPRENLARYNGYLIAIFVGAIVSEALLTLKVAHIFFLTLLSLRRKHA